MGMGTVLPMALDSGIRRHRLFERGTESVCSSVLREDDDVVVRARVRASLWL